MNKIIKNAVKELGLKCYYCTRRNENEECIVFNYSSTPKNFADNEQIGNSYVILINIYSCKNVEYYKKSVLKLMKKAGFKGGTVQNTLPCDNRVKDIKLFNTAITFKYYMSEENYLDLDEGAL